MHRLGPKWKEIPACLFMQMICCYPMNLARKSMDMSVTLSAMFTEIPMMRSTKVDRLCVEIPPIIRYSPSCYQGLSNG